MFLNGALLYLDVRYNWSSIKNLSAKLAFIIILSLNFNKLFAQSNYYLTVKPTEWVTELLNDNRTNIIFFISPLCPLCQSYSLTFRQLLQTYADTNKYCFTFIVPGKTFTINEINNYIKEYQLPKIRLIRDTNMIITHAFHAYTTPEVYVLTAKCKLMYYGRIDNWAFDLGRKRTQITSHELIDCLKLIDQQINFKPYHKKAIGCFIE